MEQQNKEDTTTKSCHEKNYLNFSIPGKTVIALLLFTVATALILELTTVVQNLSQVTLINDTSSDLVPKYAVYGKSRTEEHLVHVFNVLRRIGYKRVSLDEDWDLLWAHDYPYFKLPEKMQNLKETQLVNHIPGCGFLTNKVDLSTASLPFLPAAFRLPQQREQFLSFAEKHPNTLFVQKHNKHRHIVIKAPAAIKQDVNDSFVQEFIQNPYLVDGYKFDIGVYVLVTSIDPLLVYMYKGDVLFRYCAQPYHPFDATNVDKYVVGDDYLPTWEVPSLRKYFNTFGSNMRDAFDAYVRDQSQDPSKIWQQVEHIVRETVLAKHNDIAGIVHKYKSGRFFELMRFDLIIDDQLKVHLMEANMSPNLSSAHFKQNSLLYEQIIYNTLHTLGVGSAIKIFDDGADEMITAERNIVINLNVCAKHNCDKSCHLEACEFCMPCLTGKQYDQLAQAHREHLHKVDMHRIFPKPILNNEIARANIAADLRNLTSRNQWLTRWFYAKCLQDRSYCY